MSLSTDIGYINDGNGGALEPKLTPTLNKKDQIPAKPEVDDFFKESFEIQAKDGVVLGTELLVTLTTGVTNNPHLKFEIYYS